MICRPSGHHQLSRVSPEDELHRQNQLSVGADLATIIQDWLNDDLDQFDAVRLIRGGPGSGKSTFARALASGFAFEREGVTLKDVGVQQCILIPLQRVPAHISDTAEILNWFLLDRTHFNDRPKFDFSTRGKLLVIFDGLDELSGGGQAALEASQQFMLSTSQWLRSRNAETVNTVCVVVGRDLAVRRAGARLGLAPHQSLELLPYTINERGLRGEPAILLTDQWVTWWGKWSSENPDSEPHLPQALRNSTLSELSSEPLLLYILAITKIYRQEVARSSNRYQIYDLILNRVTSNWHNRTGNQNVQFSSDPELLDLLETIATAAWKDGGRVTTIKRVKELSPDRPMTELGVSKLVFEKEISQALLAFYLRVDGSANENIGIEFTHKSFCEFLISRRLAKQIQETLARGGSFLDKDADLSTSPGGYESINSEIADFLCDAFSDWTDVETEAARNVALKTIDHASEALGGTANSLDTLSFARVKLAAEISVVLLGIVGPLGRQFQIKWETTHDAKRLFGNLFDAEVTSGWFWRHEYTSLVPESPCLGASRLAYFDFSGQSFVGMRFTGLNLFGCTFEGCDLRGAQFIDCVLCDASFMNSNLQGTCWNGSNLSGSNFEGATTDASDFSLANGTHTARGLG